MHAYFHGLMLFCIFLKYYKIYNSSIINLKRQRMTLVMKIACTFILKCHFAVATSGFENNCWPPMTRDLNALFN